MEYKSKFTGEEIDALLTEVQEGGNLGEIKEQIANKADKNGHYPEFTAGFADNLVGRGEAIPAEFSFRASGGKSIEDGSARIKTLKGNAVVWNQMQNNVEGITVKNTTKTVTNNKYVLASSVSSMAGNLYQENYRPVLIANHRYIIVSDCINSRGEEPKINIGSYYGVINKVFTAPSDGDVIFFPFGTSTQINVGDTATFSHIKVHDLTKMFGAGNEPITIEEFYSRIPVGVDLHAYNEGEVIPFTAEGVKSVGDNAWDEEWELGTLNLATGGTGESSSQLRSKNFCKLIGGEEYNLHSTTNTNAGQILLYDKDYKYLDYYSFYGNDRLLEVPQQAQYFKILLQTSYGITYNHDICVSLVHSGYKEGKYYPYEEDIRKIDQRIKEEFPNGMKSANGVFDKVYNKNGKGYIEKRIGVKRMKDLTWTSPNSTLMALGIFNANIADMRLNNMENENVYRKSGILSSKYAISSTPNFGEYMDDKSMWRQGFEYGIVVRDSACTSVEAFVASLNDDVVYYELAEPTIIEYDEPFNLDYLVWDFGTEEIIADKSSAPLKADIIYQFNAVDEIRELRQLIATMQAQLANMTNIN